MARDRKLNAGRLETLGDLALPVTSSQEIGWPKTWSVLQLRVGVLRDLVVPTRGWLLWPQVKQVTPDTHTKNTKEKLFVFKNIGTGAGMMV